MEFLYGYQDVAILILRLSLGLIFLVHGLPKLKSLQKTGESFSAMGFYPGAFWGTVVAIGESLGGLSVALGWYSQWGALVIAAIMFVALSWKMVRGQGMAGGFELDLILLAVALFLMTSPLGGFYSLDYYLLPK
jgi:putative oxidoreductase